MARDYLSNTAFKFRDITEQPDSRYVMILQGSNAVPQIAIALDRIDVEDNVVYGYRDGSDEKVISFPMGIEFGLFRRDLFEPISRREAMKRAQDDLKSLQDLKKEMDPEGAAAEEMVHAIEHKRLEELHKSTVAVPSGTLPGGTYL